MTKAFKMQLSNFIREEKEDEFIDLELVAGIEVPNYVLILEYLECTNRLGVFRWWFPDREFGH
jgi:hypothetical protein